LRAFESFSLEDFTHSLHSEAQAKRGEEPEIDPEQFQDPDNEYGLFAGTTYEQDDEEADKIYDDVDQKMDSRRRARRCVLSG
jgi:pre-mRNA-processing factor 6